jgi:hypothetical protein
MKGENVLLMRNIYIYIGDILYKVNEYDMAL